MYADDTVYVLTFHTKSNPKKMRFDCITPHGYEDAVAKLRKRIGEEPIVDKWHSEDVI